MGKRWAIAVPLLAAALVFASSLDGKFVWDDWHLIVHNTEIHDLHRVAGSLVHPFWGGDFDDPTRNPVYRGVYRPVVTLSYALEYALFQVEPFGYHVVNLGLHLLCVWLVFRWLRRRFGEHPWALAAGTLLFALHPTRPEAVTWISGGPDLWMTLLVLMALECWDRRQRAAGYVLATGVLLGLGFLAKEVAITMLVVLAGDSVLRSPTKRDAGRWFGVSAVVASVVALRFALVPLSSVANDASLLNRARLVLGSLGYYLEITFWPWAPSAQRALRLLSCEGAYVPPLHATLLGASLVVTTLLVVMVAISRASWRPWLADALFFLVPLTPVVNLIDLRATTLVAERFLYLPMLGVAALLVRAWCVVEARPNRLTASIMRTTLLALTLAMGVTTTIHAEHFSSDEAIWKYEYQRDPQNAAAARQWAGLLFGKDATSHAILILRQAHIGARERCDYQEAARLALEYGRRVVEAVPSQDRKELERLHNVYERFEATGIFEIDADVKFEAVGAGRQHSQMMRNYILPRARLLAAAGALPEAEALLARGTQMYPRGANVWGGLIRVRARQGKWAEAHAAAREALKYLPGSRTLMQAIEELQAEQRKAH